MLDYGGYVKLLGLCLSLSLIVSCGSQFPSSHSESSLQSHRKPLSGTYPQAPHPNVTPGDICDTPSRYRYPEHIAYCDRAVTPTIKWKVIREYDEKFGYAIQEMNRNDFKIDHMIPLCMGGSNSEQNLWPQHKSVYEITDPLEYGLCNLMASGNMMQEEALYWIRLVKFDLSQATEVHDRIDEGY